MCFSFRVNDYQNNFMYICPSYDRDTNIHAMGRHRAERFVRRNVEDGGTRHHADDCAPASHGLRGKGVDRHHSAHALYGRYHGRSIL